MQDSCSQYDLFETVYDPSQPDPGLDAKSKPKTDHGETPYKGSGKLAGRKELITGGDSGIGRAVAIAFAPEGADIVLNYLTSEQSDGKETEHYLEDSGVKFYSITGDVSNEKFCNDLVNFAVNKLGHIEILVNNAGQKYYVEKPADLSSAQFQKTYATNVFSMFWMTQAAAPHRPKGSSTINTTSIQSYQPSAGLLDYASSKGAITGFTKSLAKMLIHDGIRVNAVAPGPIWTPLQQSGGQPPERVKDFGQGVPVGRPGQPAELAPMCVFLASQESSYITAEVMGGTGGGHLP